MRVDRDEPPGVLGPDGRRYRGRGGSGRRLPSGVRVLVVATHGSACHLCGYPIHLAADPGDPLGLDVDHVVPVSQGGGDDIGNLRPAHATCNRSRGTRPVVSVPPVPGVALAGILAVRDALLAFDPATGSIDADLVAHLDPDDADDEGELRDLVREAVEDAGDDLMGRFPVETDALAAAGILDGLIEDAVDRAEAYVLAVLRAHRAGG